MVVEFIIVYLFILLVLVFLANYNTILLLCTYLTLLQCSIFEILVNTSKKFIAKF